MFKARFFTQGKRDGSGFNGEGETIMKAVRACAKRIHVPAGKRIGVDVWDTDGTLLFTAYADTHAACKAEALKMSKHGR